PARRCRAGRRAGRRRHGYGRRSPARGLRLPPRPKWQLRWRRDALRAGLARRPTAPPPLRPLHRRAVSSDSPGERMYSPTPFRAALAVLAVLLLGAAPARAAVVLDAFAQGSASNSPDLTDTRFTVGTG